MGDNTTPPLKKNPPILDNKLCQSFKQKYMYLNTMGECNAILGAYTM